MKRIVLAFVALLAIALFAVGCNKENNTNTDTTGSSDASQSASTDTSSSTADTSACPLIDGSGTGATTDTTGTDSSGSSSAGGSCATAGTDSSGTDTSSSTDTSGTSSSDSTGTDQTGGDSLFRFFGFDQDPELFTGFRIGAVLGPDVDVAGQRAVQRR